MKKAFLTGITGQDGSYLAEFFIEQRVCGSRFDPSSSSFNTERIDPFTAISMTQHKIFLHYGDLSVSRSAYGFASLYTARRNLPSRSPKSRRVSLTCRIYRRCYRIRNFEKNFRGIRKTASN